MTSEFLLEAIGQMDDELVLEAAAPVRRTIPWAKVSGLAAALLLCVGIAHIPGLLPMKGLSAGTAAPEVGGGFPLLNDAVLDQDAEDTFEYRSEQESQVQAPSAANKSESAAADGTAQGVMEPKFFTQRGVYLLIAPPSQAKLPDDAKMKELGKLASAVPGTQVYPSTGTEELVGCPVWESEDGEYLYIQLPNGDWLTAKRYQ